MLILWPHLNEQFSQGVVSGVVWFSGLLFLTFKVGVCAQFCCKGQLCVMGVGAQIISSAW